MRFNSGQWSFYILSTFTFITHLVLSDQVFSTSQDLSHHNCITFGAANYNCGAKRIFQLKTRVSLRHGASQAQCPVKSSFIRIRVLG